MPETRSGAYRAASPGELVGSSTSLSRNANGPKWGRSHSWRRGWDMRDSSLSRALRTRRVLRASSAVQVRSRRTCRTQWLRLPTTLQKCKQPRVGPFAFPGGEGGIRTHGTVKPYTGFRIRRIRPLCHLSRNQASQGHGGPSGAYARLIPETRPSRFALRASFAVQNRSRRFCRPLCHLSRNQASHRHGGPSGAYARLIHETRPSRFALRASFAVQNRSRRSSAGARMIRAPHLGNNLLQDFLLCQRNRRRRNRDFVYVTTRDFCNMRFFVRHFPSA
jgi:hypothetical protein